VSYFQALWGEIPGAAPELFELRRSFLVSQLGPGARVVDIGCGEGWFAAALAEAGWSAVGVEVAEEPLRRARLRHPGVEFVLAGETSMPFPDASFDVAWLGEVLEHVRDGIGLLNELGRVLGPDGRLVISTPDHPWRRRLWLGLSRRAFEAHFEPRADHLRFFTRRTLGALLDACGFEVLRQRSVRGTLLVTARVARGAGSPSRRRSRAGSKG
jgi:ubiquinone/menaquinone biosynthesis C-methylase UbiE